MFYCPRPIHDVYQYRHYYSKGWDWPSTQIAHDFARRCFKGKLLESLCKKLSEKRPELAQVKVTETCFEPYKNVPQRISLTDLSSVIAFGDKKHGIMQVDCKRDESFGKIVNLKSKRLRDVIIDFDGKAHTNRHPTDCYLRASCESFGIESKDAIKLPFQMLLRARNVLNQAYLRSRVFGEQYDTAIWLIHSSSKENKGFEEFNAFSKLIGIPIKRPGNISGPAKLTNWEKETVNFYLGWIVDKKPYNYSERDYILDSKVQDNDCDCGLLKFVV